MKRSQQLFEKIELFLKGNLSSEEHEDFVRELKGDSNLRHEVKLHRFLESEIKDTDSIEFRRKLIDIGLKKKKRFRWAVAASFILLLGLTLTFWVLSRVDNTHLFDKYYDLYPIEDVIRGGEKSREEKIVTAYDNHKFNQAIPELKSLILKEPKNELLKLYLGNAQLQIGETKEASIILKEVNAKSPYYEDAQWYLALSYLKLDTLDEALPVLKEIVRIKGKHKKSAQSLLSELERL